MKTPNSPPRLCGVRLTDGMMADLVTEAARQTIARGRSVSAAAIVRAAVGAYLSSMQRVANPHLEEAGQ